MTVKIRCVFRGGEPPIKVTFSRRKRIIAHALGRVLGFVLKPRIKDGGRYACKAIDARNNSVTHAINLKIPGMKTFEWFQRPRKPLWGLVNEKHYLSLLLFILMEFFFFFGS